MFWENPLTQFLSNYYALSRCKSLRANSERATGTEQETGGRVITSTKV